MTAQEKYKRWSTQKNLNIEVKQQFEEMNNDEAVIYESFYRELEFGTGGLRGVLGAGTNRMNVYTVGKATQGLANFLNASFKQPSVAIAYDSRINSELFAKTAAEILAANNIQVYIYPYLMPTPCLSFAVRHYGCSAGIVITASHNPAKYNGYKVYGSDGCQVTLDMANEILSCIEKIDEFEDVLKTPFESAIGKQIKYITKDVEEDFYKAVKAESVIIDSIANKALKVIYTPLNGAGNKPVRRILDLVGITQVHIVPEQENPDGHFTTCPYPNPEVREALAKGLELCQVLQPDLLVATDPDCDRVGIAVQQNGEYVLISGNEVGVLLLDFICKMRMKNGTMPKEPVAIKTIVTTAMAADVAKNYGVKLLNVLTGFKFIGEQIGLLEAQGKEKNYIFGFEESYGYLSGSYVRDKDAVNGAMHICEMTAQYKAEGKTLVDVLQELYKKYGFYKNELMNFGFEGAEGMEKMKAIMQGLRSNPPQMVCNSKVIEISDYLLSQRKQGEKLSKIDLPQSDVLEFVLETGSSFVVRPSGTEPKLKIYLSAKGENAKHSEEIIDCLKIALTEIVEGK